ncbi:delta-1-pyrroline-5-carboxylate dehydrogenase, mitochondrial [Frankliniella occidentalis]|uniref:Multifunctional fusion protein n=1 Tax=Frankliniella occidentalis TaxID=133901 RepID=A0A9C6XS91_FRAOC|nr:delta-1-pyrroline-5-carboxylate dehydrogenase, mitochondrial [Frankliniella occidentalis]
MYNLCRQAQRVKSIPNSLQFGSLVSVDKVPNLSVKNEPILGYLPGSKELKELESALKETASNVEDVPIVIGDEEIRTKNVKYQVMPHNHSKKIAQYYYATPDLVKKAISTATEAQKKWDRVPMSERINMWMKAADLMATKYRAQLNATTMLGQAKVVIQAEIDSACELIDFVRFNAHFANELADYSPISPNPKEGKNSLRYRGIDGFIAAVSPFNFTAIGGNLAYTPALMGNGVLWKPSDTALLSNYTIFKIMREVGVPAGVVNFVPALGPDFGDTITNSKHLAGINFTGSVPTFNRLWRQVGERLNSYRNFPRLIGECGGKNYHFVHSSADVTSVVNGTIRSAFEYSGQKCSACSRAYVPKSLWPKIKEGLISVRDQLVIGDVTDVKSFTSAVIDKAAFDRIKSYIDYARSSNKHEIIGGGQYDDSQGYFVQPTIIVCSDPTDKIMKEEIFGPVLSIYVYEDKDAESVMETLSTVSPYALTGAVFAQDEKFARSAIEKLKMTAGNFYVNDKSTGSVVGQQPFGGARMSGTNDKAGGPHYVLRWANPQSVKETFVPLTDVTYPYMQG